jgi:hypothetical protein
MSLMRNGKPTTIYELMTTRIDGRRMSKPVFNPLTGHVRDSGPGRDPSEPAPVRHPMPAAPRRKPGRQVTVTKAGRVAAELAAEREKLRDLARRLLKEVDPVWITILAEESHTPIAAIGARCRGARIRTRKLAPGKTVVAEVLP